MRVAVTGTPGTGKSTVTELVETDLEVVHLNELVREAGLHEGRDDERGSLVADMEAIEARLADRDDVLIESHLAHHLPVERVVVLRCHPRELRERLLARDEHPESVADDDGSESAHPEPVAAPETEHPEPVADSTDAGSEHPEPVGDSTDPDSGLADRGADSTGSDAGPAEPAEGSGSGDRASDESGVRERSARENAEAEALDVVLSEAVEFHGLENVYEIDTTDRTPESVAVDVEAVLAGDRKPSAGDVDYIDYL